MFVAIADSHPDCRSFSSRLSRYRLAELELRAEIGRLADDLHAISSGLMTADDAWEAYPGW